MTRPGNGAGGRLTALHPVREHDDDDPRTAERIAALEAELELLTRLRALAVTLVSKHTTEDVLTLLAELTASSLPGARAAVTLVGGGEVSPTATDEVACELDQIQYELDEGPGVDAVRTGTRRMTLHAARDSERPRFSAAASARAVETIVAQPLLADNEVIGAITVYWTQPNAFRDDHVRRLDLLGEHGAAAVANTRLYASAAQLADQLGQALTSRPLIEQAKGILMAREGCDEVQAFDMLKRASQRTNRKLRDIARQVVDGVTRTTPTAATRERGPKDG
jgi:transcriptional regulator with GAF, ATPase, and Fis domain